LFNAGRVVRRDGRRDSQATKCGRVQYLGERRMQEACVTTVTLQRTQGARSFSSACISADAVRPFSTSDIVNSRSTAAASTRLGVTVDP